MVKKDEIQTHVIVFISQYELNKAASFEDTMGEFQRIQCALLILFLEIWFRHERIVIMRPI